MQKFKIFFLCIAFVALNGCAAAGPNSAAHQYDHYSGNVPKPVSSIETSTKTESEAAEEPATDYQISGTTYKGGDDIADGQYVLVSDGTGYNGLATFFLTKDMSGSEASIIAIDNFKNRTIVNVGRGQCLTVDGATLYPVLQEPAIDKSAGTLQDGMYLVGREISKGTYKVRPLGSTGSLRIWYSANHTPDALASSQDVNGETEVTLKAGQYIELDSAELIL